MLWLTFLSVLPADSPCSAVDAEGLQPGFLVSGNCHPTLALLPLDLIYFFLFLESSIVAISLLLPLASPFLLEVLSFNSPWSTCIFPLSPSISLFITDLCDLQPNFQSVSLLLCWGWEHLSSETFLLEVSGPVSCSHLFVETETKTTGPMIHPFKVHNGAVQWSPICHSDQGWFW